MRRSAWSEVWRFVNGKVRIEQLGQDGTYKRLRTSRFLPVRDSDIQRWLVDEDRRDEVAWEERLKAWAQGLGKAAGRSTAPSRGGRMTSAMSRASGGSSRPAIAGTCALPLTVSWDKLGPWEEIRVSCHESWGHRVGALEIASRIRFLVLVACLGLVGDRLADGRAAHGAGFRPRSDGLGTRRRWMTATIGCLGGRSGRRWALEGSESFLGWMIRASGPIGVVIAADVVLPDRAGGLDGPALSAPVVAPQRAGRRRPGPAGPDEVQRGLSPAGGGRVVPGPGAGGRSAQAARRDRSRRSAPWSWPTKTSPWRWSTARPTWPPWGRSGR